MLFDSGLFFANVHKRSHSGKGYGKSYLENTSQSIFGFTAVKIQFHCSETEKSWLTRLETNKA